MANKRLPRKQKDPLTEESIAVLKKNLSLEYELFDYLVLIVNIVNFNSNETP